MNGSMMRLACSAGLTVFAVLVSACSFAVEVGALPAPEIADTEAATNVPIVVSFDAMRRIIS